MLRQVFASFFAPRPEVEDRSSAKKQKETLDDPSKAMMFPVTAGQFDLVYNALSFTLASMMASTIFFWIRIGSVNEKYKSAMTIT
jgi:hypothetical protein